MKKYTKRFIICCCFTLFFFTGFTVKSLPPHLQRQGTNLVTNPDVDGSSNWISRSGMYDSSVSRDAGTGSFKMTTTYPGLNFSYIESALIPVTPGKTYTTAFYMRSDIFPPAIPNFFVGYFDSNQNYIRNSSGSFQSVTSSASWQECVFIFRPQPGTAYVRIKSYFMFQPIGYSSTIWVDNFYLGEGIGFEQAPTAKTPFIGSHVKVDALGNMEVLKSGVWTPFFPLAICGDWNRSDWTIYSAQGFNTEMRAMDVSALQRAQDAVSSFNPDGMMCGFGLSTYISPGSSNYNDLTLLETKINAIKTAGMIEQLLLYYWDNENCYDEWQVPLAVANKIKELDVDVNLDRMNPIYALQGNEGIARKYNNSSVNMTDIVGGYTTCDIASLYPDETRGALDLVTMSNIEQQQNPVVFAQINNGIGLAFRPRLFNAIAKGAKAMSFWRDTYLNPTPDLPRIEDQLWWNDLPNIRREIDQLLPIIRMPHWTSWSLSSNNSLIDFGTRDYKGKGYIIVTNEQDSAQSVTFTISSLPYTAITVKNFFTHEIEMQITGSQFTVSIPAYGSKVYVLENNIEEMLTLKLQCNESGGATTYDESYFINDGTLNGNATLSNGVLTMDGSGDYVNCGNDSSLEMGKLDLSIVASAKISTSQSGIYAGIVTKGASSPTNAGYSFLYRTDTQKLVLVISNGSIRSFLTAPTAFNMKDDTWHTIGVALDRDGNAEFYVDGASKGTASASSLASSDITNTAQALNIGRWAYGNYLNGQMDNVRIYKKALTSQEITDLSGNITLDMQFNDTSGNPFDSSIYSNDGTLLNGAILENGTLNLDGTNDRANCGNDSSLEMGLSDMTIIAKVKMAPSQGTYAGIMTKGAGSPSNAGYCLVYYNNTLIFMISDGTTRLWLNSNGNLSLNDDVWHTIGVSVARNGNVVFYVDGNAVGSANASALVNSNISNASNDLLIGSWINNWHFNGDIDNISIYKRALNAQEIAVF
jgi:Concanavalin A-like lectin/glucanases superfamily